MVTPFDESGAIDEAGVVRLMAWFRSAGCTGVVVAGTNGEGPSLGAVEKRDLVRLTVSVAAGLSVILGLSTSSLEEAVWLAAQAGKAGAEALLAMPPSYFKEATTDGLAKWFETLMDRSPLPVLLYNIPQRTGVRLELETLSRLARHPNMLGIKDSSGDKDNLKPYRDLAPGKRLFVGDETLLWASMEMGWNGTISGASNVISQWLVPVVTEFESDRHSSLAKFDVIQGALQALRGSPQPFTNKEILRRLGVIPKSDVRLPLGPTLNEALEKASDLVLRLHHL